jgi:Protein of unknown function (DUF998)
VLRDIALWLRPAGWPPLPEAARGRVRRLAWFAIFAQVVFIVGYELGGALEPHYSQLRQYISELGRQGAADPWIFELSVAIWGVGFIALADAIAPALRTRPWPLAMPGLLVLAGVFAILVAPFHLDCSPTVSALCRAHEDAGTLSWHHYAHEWLGLGIEVALGLTPFALARSTWPSRLSRMVLAGGLVVVVAWIVLFGGFDGYHGLEERLWALVGQVWVLLCAAVLIGETRLERDAIAAPRSGHLDGAPVAGAPS